MKNLLLIVLSGLLIFVGCDTNPLTRPGMISMYVGNVDATASAASLKTSGYSIAAEETSNEVLDAYIYIKSLEMSVNNQDWIKIFEGTTEFKAKSEGVHQVARVKIGDIAAAEGTYTYLRLIYDVKIRILEVNTYSGPTTVDKTFTKLPRSMGIGTGLDQRNIDVTDTIVFSVDDSTLNDIVVQRDKSTLLQIVPCLGYIAEVEDVRTTPITNDNIIDWWINTIFITSSTS